MKTGVKIIKSVVLNLTSFWKSLIPTKIFQIYKSHNDGYVNAKRWPGKVLPSLNPSYLGYSVYTCLANDTVVLVVFCLWIIDNSKQTSLYV